MGNIVTVPKKTIPDEEFGEVIMPDTDATGWKIISDNGDTFTIEIL